MYRYINPKLLVFEVQFQGLNNGVERKICEAHSVFLKPGIFVKEMQLYFKRKKT